MKDYEEYEAIIVGRLAEQNRQSTNENHNTMPNWFDRNNAKISFCNAVVSIILAAIVGVLGLYYAKKYGEDRTQLKEITKIVIGQSDLNKSMQDFIAKQSEALTKQDAALEKQDYTNNRLKDFLKSQNRMNVAQKLTNERLYSVDTSSRSQIKELAKMVDQQHFMIIMQGDTVIRKVYNAAYELDQAVQYINYCYNEVIKDGAKYGSLSEAQKWLQYMIARSKATDSNLILDQNYILYVWRQFTVQAEQILSEWNNTLGSNASTTITKWTEEEQRNLLGKWIKQLEKLFRDHSKVVMMNAFQLPVTKQYLQYYAPFLFDN